MYELHSLDIVLCYVLRQQWPQLCWFTTNCKRYHTNMWILFNKSNVCIGLKGVNKLEYCDLRNANLTADQVYKWYLIIISTNNQIDNIGAGDSYPETELGADKSPNVEYLVVHWSTSWRPTDKTCKPSYSGISLRKGHFVKTRVAVGKVFGVLLKYTRTSQLFTNALVGWFGFIDKWWSLVLS